jgi:soluble lytic murein transglycosylase-like protein
MMSPLDRYDSLLQFYAEQFGLSWQLLKKQMLAESAGNPRAVSPVGAMGLFQFMPLTWREVHPNGHAFNAEDSILAGCKYMHTLSTMFGDDAKALAAYNWGMGNLRKTIKAHGDQWKDHLPGETKAYLKRILT